LKATLVGATGALFGASTTSHAAVPETVRTAKLAVATGLGGHYFPNKAPLAPVPFMKLPPGAVTPKGWLLGQINLQAHGLNGRMTEVSDYLRFDDNGWVDPTKWGWEELAYWLRGFADLSYVSGDANLLAQGNKWIKAIIAAQQPDGWFGPNAARTSLNGGPDMWPHMPILYAVRSYHEYSGDPAVIPFLTNYFDFVNKQPGSRFGLSWAGFRWADTLDAIYWLYNRTGDSMLLDLADKIHKNSDNYVDNIPTQHNVNFSQGFREPAQYWMQAKDPKLKLASYHDYDNVMGTYGQFAGGGFAGDENWRTGYVDPRQGFETCGIVELMLSHEIMNRITGDPLWADRCEYIAFNSMPAAFDPEQKGTHYVTSANSIQIDRVGKKHGQYGNGTFPMFTFEPGVHNYRCCPHNYGMGWPFYVENTWLATTDNGLCANLYAASEVKAKVGDGTEVHFAEETEYPFGDMVKLTLTTPKSVTFPLYVRIPQWAKSATIKVNGAALPAETSPLSYVIVNKKWVSGDVVTLHFPMSTDVRVWKKNQNSATVDYGPLSFSLDIQEKWSQYAGTADWPQWEVFPQSPWNYGLVLNQTNPAASFDVIKKAGAIADQPFTHDANPIELRAKARKIPNWKADQDSVVEVLQAGPIKSSEPIETITLIPMGAARLRITSFPIIGTGADAKEWPDAGALPAMSASHISDNLDAMLDAQDPAKSGDQAVRRFTWWDHEGTQEWVQHDFTKPMVVSETSVYWFDDTGVGHCRVPQSWQLEYKDGDNWKPVDGASAYGSALDTYNKVTFTPVTTTALRIAVQLQPNASGGVLRWRTNAKPASSNPAQA
jgi:hypothetical protein